MNLADAELHHITGDPIVPGRLTIGSEHDMEALGISIHERVLFAFPSARRGPSSLTSWNNLTVWPATAVSRVDSGFCDPRLADLGVVFRLLTAEHIGDLSM